jgi:hypothetical protein
MGAFGSGLAGGMQQMGQLQAMQQWNDLAKQMQAASQESLGRQIVSGAQAAPNFQVGPEQLNTMKAQDLRTRMMMPMLRGGLF